MFESEQNKFSDDEKKMTFSEMVKFLVLSILIVLPIKYFVAQPFIVSGQSMDNTFHNGQYLIVDRISYRFAEPQRGDVIVFRYPRDPSKYFIKRVIALPRETIEIKDNEVTIFNDKFSEGFKLKEPYIKSWDKNSPYIKEKLGENEYFVMGDNRDNSSDSRVWGVLSRNRITGRVLLRLFPFNKIDYLPGKQEDVNETKSEI